MLYNDDEMMWIFYDELYYDDVHLMMYTWWCSLDVYDAYTIYMLHDTLYDVDAFKWQQ